MNESPPIRDEITRRAATRLLGGTLLSNLVVPSITFAQQIASKPPTSSRLLSDEDLLFLDDLERTGCLYFAEQADPASGQVLDRAHNKTSTGALDSNFASSIAATG